MPKQLGQIKPEDIFSRLTEREQQVCFLKSVSPQGVSFLAWNPVERFLARRGEGHLPAFRDFVSRNQAIGRKLIGYLSYDLGYELYDIAQTAIDDLNLPDIYFLAFDSFLQFQNDEAEAVYKDEAFLTELAEIQQRPLASTPKSQLSTNFHITITEADYFKAYQKIKQYNRDGYIYQINLTHRLEAESDVPARELFRRVLRDNPVDFAAYIEGDGFEVLSASPERFIRIKNRAIVTSPIQGTRPRGSTPEEDERLRQELLNSEKEAAELNMITDLLRNDLGKVCEVGSVQLLTHRQTEAFPAVWHTHSTIQGELRADISALDALLSMMPGGSITGCPKKQAMQVIDELEPITRSVYTGSIGILDPNGDANFNIAIRTIIKKGQRLYLPVGGGIVYDSDDTAELQETFDKAQSFMGIVD